MKYTTSIYLLLLLLSSCNKDEPIPTLKNDISCMDHNSDFPNSEKLEQIVQKYTNEGIVGLSVLIDQKDTGIWTHSEGFANIEDNIAMNPCHLHHAASIYKTFIAVIIMQLEEEGKLELDGLVSDYLGFEIVDRLPNGKKLTLENLLQHRSGIPDIYEVEFITCFFNNPTRQYTIPELLEYVYDKDPKSEPGTDFYYSDANFTLLSLIINELEGDFVIALKDRIFSPLMMEDTYFLESSDKLPDGIVNSYWDRYNDGSIENNTEVQIALATGLPGSEGIVSTADDLKTFIQALAGGDLIENVEEMTAFVDISEEMRLRLGYAAYGYGLMKVQVGKEIWYGHFGNQIGSGAILLYNEARETTLVALQNTGTFFSDEMKGKFFYQLIQDIEGVIF